MKYWFVATTKPNADMLAAAQLREQGYIVYVAKTYEQLKEGRKSEPLGRLRLPGYIFVSFRTGEHGPVNHTRGVGSLLLDGSGDPEPMRSGIIEKLRGFEDADFEAARAQADIRDRANLCEGDEVIVDGKDHPCLGEKGFFLDVHKETARVLIGGKSWPVNIFDLRKVEKLKKEKDPAKSKKKKRGKKAAP